MSEAVMNKDGITVRLTPTEHGNLAGRARKLSLNQSEAAALAIQLLMETPIEELRKRLVPSKRAKYRFEPVRDYDPETGHVRLPTLDALPIAAGSGEAGDTVAGPGGPGPSDKRPRKPASRRKRGLTPKNRGAEVVANAISPSD